MSAATSEWHLDTHLVQRYCEGELSPSAQASVDAHVLGCPSCQALFSPPVHHPEARTAPGRQASPDRWLDEVWSGVIDAIDQPQRGSVERLLARVGVPQHTARLLVATPSLRGSWLLGVTATMTFAVLASRTSGGSGLFVLLLVAPLIPVLGTAAAFSSSTDSTHEVVAATPMHGFRLLLIRTLAVVATSLAAGALPALATRDVGWRAGAWVLPSLLLATATLALASSWSATQAAGATSAAWAAVIVVAASGGLGRWGRGPRMWDPAHVTAQVSAASSQVGLLVLTALLAAVVYARRDVFDQGRLP